MFQKNKQHLPALKAKFRDDTSRPLVSTMPLKEGFDKFKWNKTAKSELHNPERICKHLFPATTISLP